MPKPLIQKKDETQAFAVELTDPKEHHLQTDDADLSAAKITEQPQFGLASVGGKRVLVGALQFSISGCTPTNVSAINCCGNGLIVAKDDSLLSSKGMRALKEGDEGQCIGLAWNGPYPVPVICNICIGKGQSLQPDMPSPIEEQSIPEEPSPSDKFTPTLAKTFSARLLRANGVPICGAIAIAKPADGEGVKRKTNDRGEVSFDFEADECDIRFPEYDVSYEQPILNLGKLKAENSNRLLRKGCQSSEVMALQLRLNVRSAVKPPLVPDGIFGEKTHSAVIEYQRSVGLDQDGIVGPKTREALDRPSPGGPPQELKRFLPELSEASDWVEHFQFVAREHQTTSHAELFKALYRTVTTAGGRFLLVKGDPVGVVDFQHFVAAAIESYCGEQSYRRFDEEFRVGVRLGDSPGDAMILGVANEIGQCIALDKSCFAFEDLGSNRLGANFADVAKAYPLTPLDQLLGQYLESLEPLLPSELASVETQNRWEVFVEFVAAIAHGLEDILIPRAY